MEQSRFRCGDRDPEYLGGLMQRAFLQLIFSAGERSEGCLDGDLASFVFLLWAWWFDSHRTASSPGALKR